MINIIHERYVTHMYCTMYYGATYPIVGLMFGSKLSSTNLQTILDLPTPVS